MRMIVLPPAGDWPPPVPDARLLLGQEPGGRYSGGSGAQLEVHAGIAVWKLWRRNRCR